MFFDNELIYSRRYPSPMEELERIIADTARPVMSEAQIEASFREFCRSMSSVRYEPIPGREEKAREFIAQAKAFSEEHEVDMDIQRTPHSVEARLHFYCGAYPKEMTRQFARLFDLCDNLTSFVLKTEPSDFTLILEMDTHKRYREGTLIDY